MSPSTHYCLPVLCSAGVRFPRSSTSKSRERRERETSPPAASLIHHPEQDTTATNKSRETSRSKGIPRSEAFFHKGRNSQGHKSIPTLFIQVLAVCLISPSWYRRSQLWMKQRLALLRQNTKQWSTSGCGFVFFSTQRSHKLAQITETHTLAGKKTGAQLIINLCYATRQVFKTAFGTWKNKVYSVKHMAL